MSFNKKCSTQWQILLFTMLLLFTITLLASCDARQGISSSRSVPVVNSTSPANASVNVARNTKITATFSETMDLSTITSTSFLLMQGTSSVSGTVSYSGTTAVFTPADTLLPNTVYIATITTGVISAAGEPLASSVVWVFTTGALVLNTPPTIITSDPLDGAVDVPLNQKIAATFSTEMNSSTIAQSTFLVSQGEASISGSVSYSGTTAVFAPSVNMSPNTIYTVTVTTGAEDLAGNALAENVSWSFTTGDSVVTTPPLVSATNPVDSATEVVLNQEITVTFSKTMDATTLTTTTFSLKNGTTAVAGFVTCSGTTATFSPADDLLPGVLYTATVTTGVTDLAGNALETDYQWTFTTDTIAVIILPVVVSVNPLDSAIDVIRTKVLTVEFSKTMDALTITTTSFTLKNGTTDVAGTVASVGTNATFSPT